MNTKPVEIIRVESAEVCGYIDNFGNKHVSGWIFDQSTTVEVIMNLEIDGEFVESTSADLYRSDLAEMGIGEGFHGFCFNVPDRFCNDTEHLILVTQYSDAGNVVHAGSLEHIIESSRTTERRKCYEENLSLLFDRDYYIEQAGQMTDPLKHYQKIGWKKGFNPHPLFITNYFVKKCNTDITDDPLTDFLLNEAHVFVETTPLLDVDIYYKYRPELLEIGLHPLLHYLKFGWREDIKAFRLFDSSYYIGAHESDLEKIGPALLEYVKIGYKQGRRPNSQFDPLLFSRLALLSNIEEPLGHLIQSLLEMDDPATELRQRNSESDVSIIMLNFNKSILTMQSVYFLRRFTINFKIEIMILDNGSDAHDFNQLVKYIKSSNIIRSDENLGFGEANNVAVEQSTADIIVFLNNDAFVTADWLPPLIKSIQSDNVGAVGPLFVYANETIQEAGATVFMDGTVHQHGKGLYNLPAWYAQPQPVMYISAATLMMSRSTFDMVQGFDSLWDPAYYEDVDLCLKISLLEKKILYVPASKVVHLESSTSSNPELKLKDVVSLNRVKFISRWANYLAKGDRSRVRNLVSQPTTIKSPKQTSPRRRLGIFTPFALYPGGGEKYILSIAHHLKDRFDCILYTPRHTSAIRLRNLSRELNLNLDHVECINWSSRGKRQCVDFFISMGNDLLPNVFPIGSQANFYICQFPFPSSLDHITKSWAHLEGYDKIIVYSDFVLQAVLSNCETLGLQAKPIVVLSPPIQLIAGTRKTAEKLKILNVGRFSPEGHCKRQDVMIDIISKSNLDFQNDVELHLAGSLPSDPKSRAYFANLQIAGAGLPVFFYPNISIEDLNDLYLSSDVYWHLTGIKDNFNLAPYRFEHFGITVVEAMSAGSIPIVLDKGGPASIVQDQINGFHAKDRYDVYKKTKIILDMNIAERESLIGRVRNRALEFSSENFKSQLEIILDS